MTDLAGVLFPQRNLRTRKHDGTFIAQKMLKIKELQAPRLPWCGISTL